MAEIVRFEEVSKSFNSLKVIQKLDLVIKEGEIVSFIGPSGCGKTTILKMIIRLEEEEDGKVIRNFKNPAFIFQEPRLLPWRDTLENICFVLKDKIKNRDERLQIVRKYINMMGLSNFENYYPSQLSGGMKKRVAIARALSINPDIILMDEPFSDLDFPLRLLLIENLTDIFKKEKKTVVYVTHDIREALMLSDRIYVLTAKPSHVKEEIKSVKNDLKLEEDIIEFLKEESLKEAKK